jgi:epoxide hydrolase 4
VAVADPPEDQYPPGILLINGWPDPGVLWDRQIPALVEAGYRVIVPDQRGFGRSDLPGKVADYAIGLSVEDMVAVLNAHEARSAPVVGHDRGA